MNVQYLYYLLICNLDAGFNTQVLKNINLAIKENSVTAFIHLISVVLPHPDGPIKAVTEFYMPFMLNLVILPSWLRWRTLCI